MAESARSSNNSNFLATRLERAAKRANDHWFPSNPQLIGKISNGLKEGNYDLDIEFLLAELKTDFSLFTFCLKEAFALLRAEGTRVDEENNPIAVLRAAGLPKIKKILDKCDKRISTHSLSESSPVQQARIKEAMVSASAAEVMAPFQSIDPEVGFSAAILRQLGTALISWNYPSVYQRCLERSDTSLSIDQALNDTLGFSPTVFGAYLLGRWGVAQDLRVVVGADPTAMDGEPLTEMQMYLKKICEVGEALSRAQSPEYYPTAESDWETARSTIEGTLGPEGMRSIQEHVRKNCDSYRAFFKQEFADTAQLNPGARLVACRDEHLNDRNPYIKGCLPYLKKSFRELYAQMDINTISQHSVRALTNDLIPLAGFTGGCVFVLDPNGRQFIPRLVVGKVELRTLGPVPYSEYSTRHDPVIVAFDCQTPMIEHSKTGAPDDPACITAVLGIKQRLGVLYLEIPQSALNDFDQNVLMHFKAVRKALEDALHIS